MADKRIHELPDATTWDGYIPQDKSGGTTQRVSAAQVETRLIADGFAKTDQIPAASAIAPADLAASAGIGASSAFARADHVHKKPDVPWDEVSSKPNPISALASLFPLADTVPFFTGAATADRMSFAEFSRAVVAQGTAAGWRYLLSVPSIDDALPKNNPTATGLLTAPAIRNTGGAANALIKWDADGDEVASSLSDNGTTVSGINLSASGAVDSGLSRMQSSAVNPTTQAWFGHAGLNSAGAYVGYYADDDGAIRLAAAAGELLSLGTGAAYGQLVISDSGVASSSLAGTGARAVAADSTGKLVSVSKPDFFHGAWASGSSTLLDITDWVDPLVDEAHYRCFAAGKHVSATATETRFRFIIGGVSSSTYTVYSKGDWTVNFDVTTIGGAGASVCANLCVYGNNATAACIELSSLSYTSAYGIRLQIASDDDNADMRGLCTRLERLQ